MKTKNMLWAALSMTAALVMTACTNDDNTVETPAAPQAEVKTIPYSVTVNDGAATTRSTVDSDNKTLRFATGDKLYITGTNVKGVLEITSGVGETTGATFSGNLTYTGDGSPASDLALTATLVSAQQTVGTEVSVDAAGAVTVNYPATAYCDDVATAVQKYSNLTGTSTYGEKSFTLSQQTAFLNFVITFEDGTATGTELSAVVKNGETTLCTANRTTTTEREKVVAKFVLPAASGTTLSSATVKMGDKEAISFGASQTLEGKVYNVKRTLYDKEVTLGSDNIEVPAGKHWKITGSNAHDSNITIGDGATVTLSGVTMFMDSDEPCIKCSGDATIILADGTTNTLTTSEDYGGGILAGPTGKTLTIKGNTGVLTVEIKHSSDATAIGAYYETPCGDIVIEGGVINATSQNGAAIGACYEAACGNITISGGTVTAKAGGADDYSGVGIGGHYNTACGNINITGGTVTATGFKSPGIGGDNICGAITISGGTVKATKGELADNCIGIGNSGTCGTITIGGTVYWDGSNYQNGGGSYLTQDQIIYPAP